jgi:hypothetical protein
MKPLRSRAALLALLPSALALSAAAGEKVTWIGEPIGSGTVSVSAVKSAMLQCLAGGENALLRVFAEAVMSEKASVWIPGSIEVSVSTGASPFDAPAPSADPWATPGAAGDSPLGAPSSPNDPAAGTPAAPSDPFGPIAGQPSAAAGTELPPELPKGVAQLIDIVASSAATYNFASNTPAPADAQAAADAPFPESFTVSTADGASPFEGTASQGSRLIMEFSTRKHGALRLQGTLPLPTVGYAGVENEYGDLGEPLAESQRLTGAQLVYPAGDLSRATYSNLATGQPVKKLSSDYAAYLACLRTRLQAAP